MEQSSADELNPTQPSNSSSSQETTTTDSPSVCHKDDEYYIDSTFAVFQAENCLFRAPTYIFAEAPVFGGMFSLPQTDASFEGSSPDNPIILPENVSSVDFENLLEALHPQELTLTLSLTTPKWVSVLKLSTMWLMNKFRALAISELERMGELTPLQKVQLGRTCKISSWLVQGFKEFASASSSITREDAVVLALGSVYTTYRLCRIREKRSSLQFGNVHNMIEDEFRDELSEIRSHEETFKVAEPDIPVPTFGNAEETFELGAGKNTPPVSPRTTAESFNDAIDTLDQYDLNFGQGPFELGYDINEDFAPSVDSIWGGAKKKKKKK